MNLYFKYIRLFFIVTGLLSCSSRTWDPEINAVLNHKSKPHVRASIAKSNSKVSGGLASRARLNGSANSIGNIENTEDVDSSAPSIVLRDNAHVRKFVSLYTGKRKRDLELPLARFDEYRPLVEKVLDYYNLPLELSNVAFVESKFDTEAVSEDGAVGVWQFMRPTAENLGLDCSYWNDERKDVLRSTIAAAKYLTELNNRFDDWLLALAAYNAGPNRVANAIQRAGGERDFYKLAAKKLLPRETINHVSKFIAITMITNNPDLYEINSSNEDVYGDKPLVN